MMCTLVHTYTPTIHTHSSNYPVKCVRPGVNYNFFAFDMNYIYFVGHPPVRCIVFQHFVNSEFFFNKYVLIKVTQY